MDGLNCCMFVGNLGKDAELKYGQSGTAVLTWSVACTTKYKDKAGDWKERTEWVDCVTFGKRAEGLAKLLTKGRTVFVQGELKTDSWEKDGEKKYKKQILADRVILMGGGKSEERSEPRGGGTGGHGGSSAPKPRPNVPDDFGHSVDDGDNLPF